MHQRSRSSQDKARVAALGVYIWDVQGTMTITLPCQWEGLRFSSLRNQFMVSDGYGHELRGAFLTRADAWPAVFFSDVP